jgi:pyroglutamyl-peptidase
VSINTSVLRSRQNPTVGQSAVCILVTGFGAFPGARANPTSALIRALEKERPRLVRFGIRLELAILPVVYSKIESWLEALVAAHRPEAILHFGLAARSGVIAVETRAMNRLSALRHDASGSTATRLQIRPGAPQSIRSSFPAVEIAAALHRAGITCRLSKNAGKYICNQTLYLSLAQGTARQIGFIHIPRFAARRKHVGSAFGSRPSLVDLTRAAIIAILIMARKLRCNRIALSRNTRSAAARPASLDRIASLA